MKRSFVQLHIAVFLAGFTGILGKLITLNEGLLVWYRLLITAVTLWVIEISAKYFRWGRPVKAAGRFEAVAESFEIAGELGLVGPAEPVEAVRLFMPTGQAEGSGRLDRKDLLRIAGIGGIAALHWVCFYGSIKYSNVSVGLVCLSSIGFFTALLEPILLGHRHDPVELLLGLLVIAGIVCIFSFDPHYKTGILIGMLSTLLGSIFPILNKRMLERVSASTLTLYELSGGFICLSLLMPLYLYFFPTRYLFPNAGDWGWLLILSWICTVLAFRLSMNALRHVSAFTVNLSYNMEPVYGIFMAFVVYREDRYLNGGFYAGFACVILAIGLQMGRLWYLHKKRPVTG